MPDVPVPDVVAHADWSVDPRKRLLAVGPAEICLRRPFYPARPGGARRSDSRDGPGLSGPQLRRRSDGTDAETLFWTLGAKQVGKAALNGWRCSGLGRASSAAAVQMAARRSSGD